VKFKVPKSACSNLSNLYAKTVTFLKLSQSSIEASLVLELLSIAVTPNHAEPYGKAYTCVIFAGWQLSWGRAIFLNIMW
jgi:hypothetical protein